MTDDERAIRDLVATWIEASRRGDLDAILPLMADDVVFLVNGQPPMRGRDAFAASFRAAGQQQKIDAASDIEEIAMSGDLAYCVSRLQVTITPPGGAPNRRSGYVLTVLRKEPRGNWVIARDVNLLAPDPPRSTS
jgi:uncharacterized protein (TIGR02246 family)